MINLKQVAKYVMEMCRENGAGGTRESQPLALAEEVGEFVGAYRRWSGQARRRGTEAEAKAELADVILSAYCAADVFGWDVDEIVKSKVDKILTRGWKEPEA